MKAMILAAGRGERMRPLTDHTPKPLLAVAGKPMIVRHIEALAAVGVREIVINVAWLGEHIVAALGDGAAFGVSLVFSREETALETAGGIAYARHLLGDAPFLLLSADIVTDYPLTRLTAAAAALANDPDRLAHLVVVPNPPYHPGGDFGLTADGLIDPDADARLCYANLMVLKPALVAEVPAGAIAPLGPLLKAAARQGRISGERYEGGWFNVGTVDELAAASAAVYR